MGSPLSIGKYLALTRVGVLVWMAYRLGALMRLIDFPIIIGVYSYLFAALYRSLPAGERHLGGLDLNQTLTYIALVWIIESLINTRLDADIGNDVRDGRIAVYLARPVDVQGYYLFQTLGHVGYRLAMISIPIALFAAFAFGVHLPPDWAAGGAFLLAGIGAFALMFLINFCLGIVAFFMEWNYGLSLMKEALLRGLGGLLIPLTVMPASVQSTLLKTPFPYLYYIPVQVWLGSLRGPGLSEALTQQYCWVALLLLLSRLLQTAALRRVSIAGG